MRKLAMAMAVAALAVFAQGARAEDAAKERREAASATKDQVKSGADDATSDVKQGAHDTRDAANAQADRAGDKMSDAKHDAKDRMAQANDKKHSLFDGKDNFNVDGKIQKVSKDTLTISRGDLPPATLRISKETKVELDGNAVSAGQLKQGQDVKASFNLRQDKPEAVEIKAKKASDQK